MTNTRAAVIRTIIVLVVNCSVIPVIFWDTKMGIAYAVGILIGTIACESKQWWE